MANSEAEFALLTPNLPRGADPLLFNGLGSHTFHIPGVDCPTCGMSWGSGRVVPFSCPEELKEVVVAAWGNHQYRSLQVNLALRTRCENALARSRNHFSLRPGDSFPSFRWKLACHPTRQLYWPLNEPVCAQRLASSIHAATLVGVLLFEVDLVRVGDYESPNDIPDECWRWCNDPEDIVDVVFPVEETASFGKYYSLIPVHNTYFDWRDNQGPKAQVCEACGDMTIPKPLVIEENIRNSRWRKDAMLPRQYTPEADLFRSHVYPEGVVVSRRMLSLLAEEDLAWFEIRPLTVAD